jgi:hypothetical protein
MAIQITPIPINPMENTPIASFSVSMFHSSKSDASITEND